MQTKTVKNSTNFHDYLNSFQEIIPLNAGNIFGAEDNRPVPIWENVIRGTLNKIQPEKTKFKCYSNPSSPSRFKPSEDAPDIEDEVVLESDSEGEEEVHPFNEESCFDDTLSTIQEKKLVCFPSEENVKELVVSNNRKLTRILSGTERIGLSWPEPPLDLLAQCATTERPNSLKTVKSFTTSKSFRSYASFKSYINVDINNNRVIPEEALVADLDLDSTLYRKRRPPYVKIVSKQMVGVFITIWVRRRLRKHIQNVHVSAVGVGVMGYIGNKVTHGSYFVLYYILLIVPFLLQLTDSVFLYFQGSISVSMSIYQTLFCFICTHLTSGEREADAAKRNADVHEIHKRTRFSSFSKNTLPKKIDNHE